MSRPSYALSALVLLAVVSAGCQALTTGLAGLSADAAAPATSQAQATGTLTLRLRVPVEALPGYATATIPGGAATLTLTLSNPGRIGADRVVNVPLVGGQTLYTVTLPSLPVGDGYTLAAEAKNGFGTRLAYGNRLETGASDPVLNQPGTGNPYALPPLAFTVKSGANNVGLGLRILPVAGNAQGDAPGTLDGSARVDAGYLRPLTVTTTSAIAAGYAVALTLDTAALVGAGKLRADLNDLRVLYWTGSRYVELTRAVEAPNTASTTIRFRTQKAIAASGSDAGYRLVYGNNLAGQAPSDPGQVYDWYESFEHGSSKLEARGWMTLKGNASATASAGTVRTGARSLKIDSTLGDMARDLSLNYAFPANFVMQAWFYDDLDTSRNDWIAPQVGSDAGGGVIGLYTGTNTTTYHFFPASVAWTASAVNRTMGWHRYEFRRHGGTMAYLVDGVQVATAADARAFNCVFLRSGSGAAPWSSLAVWDDMSIRAYVSPEPLASLGAEGGL